MTKIAACRTLLTGAALAVAGVFIAGCTSQGSSSSAPAQATSATSAAQSPPTSRAAAPTTPAGSAPAGSAGPSSARAPATHSSGGSSSGESVPGVIDCGKSLSRLDVRPTSLMLVCSDGTAGLQDLTWSHWGHNITTGGPGQTVPSATATGTGEFFLNDCNPNCAQGRDHTFPVQVTLSVVYSSPYGGTYFGQASLRWPGNRPSAGTKSTYILPDPSGL
jgi:hypothetical protein